MGFRQRFGRKRTTDTSTGASLSVTHDTGKFGGGSIIELHVESSAAATFTIEASADNATFRDTGLDQVLTGAGFKHAGFRNAYRFIRVSTTNANDNIIEILSAAS